MILLPVAFGLLLASAYFVHSRFFGAAKPAIAAAGTATAAAGADNHLWRQYAKTFLFTLHLLCTPLFFVPLVLTFAHGRPTAVADGPGLVSVPRDRGKLIPRAGLWRSLPRQPVGSLVFAFIGG
jgi:hypothetical protein